MDALDLLSRCQHSRAAQGAALRIRPSAPPTVTAILTWRPSSSTRQDTLLGHAPKSVKATDLLPQKSKDFLFTVHHSLFHQKSYSLP